MADEEEAPSANENEDQPPPKKEKKKIKNKKGKSAEELVVTMPTCGHAWCLGEVLRTAGIEPGVCCPKPLPWGRPGRLPYLPGWAEPCRKYRCRPMRYGTPKKMKHEDLARKKLEVEEAKLLWSYLSPVLQFPKQLVYEDEEETKVCPCYANRCKYGYARNQSVQPGSVNDDEEPPQAS